MEEIFNAYRQTLIWITDYASEPIGLVVTLSVFGLVRSFLDSFRRVRPIRARFLVFEVVYIAILVPLIFSSLFFGKGISFLILAGAFGALPFVAGLIAERWRFKVDFSNLLLAQRFVIAASGYLLRAILIIPRQASNRLSLVECVIFSRAKKLGLSLMLCLLASLVSVLILQSGNSAFPRGVFLIPYFPLIAFSLLYLDQAISVLRVNLGNYGVSRQELGEIVEFLYSQMPHGDDDGGSSGRRLYPEWDLSPGERIGEAVKGYAA